MILTPNQLNCSNLGCTVSKIGHVVSHFSPPAANSQDVTLSQLSPLSPSHVPSWREKRDTFGACGDETIMEVFKQNDWIFGMINSIPFLKNEVCQKKKMGKI